MPAAAVTPVQPKEVKIAIAMPPYRMVTPRKTAAFCKSLLGDAFPKAKTAMAKEKMSFPAMEKRPAMWKKRTKAYPPQQALHNMIRGVDNRIPRIFAVKERISAPVIMFSINKYSP